jgi:hypothetical protein
MSIRTLDDLRAPRLTREKVAQVTALTELTIKNFLKNELIADVSGDLLSVNNCLEFVVIDKIGKAGATLRLGLLAAAPALMRMCQRLNDRTLGTQRRLQVMVFHFDRLLSRGRGYCPGRTSISPTFCAPTEVADVVAARMNDHDGVVQQVFAVDAAIEGIVAKL